MATSNNTSGTIAGPSSSDSTQNALVLPGPQVKTEEPLREHKELKVKKITLQHIHDSIPPEGIELQELAKQCKVDETNAWTFLELVSESCEIESLVRKKDENKMPPADFERRIHQAARAAPTRRRRLKDNEFILSHLEGDITITLNSPSELVRKATTTLPDFVYRAFYENNAVLSAFVSEHSRVKHKEYPNLKLKEGNAFQAMPIFVMKRDLNRACIERQLDWKRKKNPTPYISAFDNIKNAREIAEFHTREGRSRRIGERMMVAEIDSSGLMPITIHADMREKLVENMTAVFSGNCVENTEVKRKVNIPAWVDKNSMLVHGDKTTLTLEEFEAHPHEMWLSLKQLRYHDIKVFAGNKHENEWLVCGTIPMSRIIRVMPFDGKTLHEFQPRDPVKIEHGEQCWVFNWDISMWELDVSRILKRVLPQPQLGDAPEDESSSHNSPTDKDADPKHGSKRRKKLRDQNTDDRPKCNQKCEACCSNNDDDNDPIEAEDEI